jgi:hypothetical protein
MGPEITFLAQRTNRTTGTLRQIPTQPPQPTTRRTAMTEQQFIVFMEEYGQLVITTAIAIIVLIMLFHKIWPMLTKAVEIGNTLGGLPQTIERVEKKLEHLETTLNTVKMEVLPNGGSSLRDAINRTEKQLAVVGRIVAKHERDINKS